jgi:ribosome recycling factor
MASSVLTTAETKMKASVEALKKELSTIRTGRATPSLVEHVKVEYSGSVFPLNQLATIAAPEARLIVIQPWDRSSLQSIEKAIQKSDVGLHPTVDGNIIRLAVPPLTEERRREMTKVVRKKIEDRKVIIRSLRRDALEDLKKMEKDKEISQDDSRRAQDQLQRLTDAHTDTTDKIGRAKEAEVMEV